MEIVVKLRGYVEGVAEAPLVVVKHRISFYGEVHEGKLVDGRALANRILVAEGTRGSTVAPYIIYGLSKKGQAPKAIVVSKIEPMLVAGCVMASIPLAGGLPRNIIDKLRDGCKGKLVVEPPSAQMIITC